MKNAPRLRCLSALALLVAARTIAATAARPLRVPFEYAKDRNSILVRVRIDDKPALLILDTGSAHTVLRPECLGVKKGEVEASRPPSPGAGFLGDAIGREVSLEIGGRTWPRHRVAVMDLSEVLAVYSERVDGVLGLDFLQQFRSVVLDLNAKTITLAQ